MKYGEVVHIRLSPEDIMGCIDVCTNANVTFPGMSLASMVKLALAGMLEAQRRAKNIPQRDGFEYSEMVQPFLYGGRNARKLAISSQIEKAEVNKATFEEQTPPAISRAYRRISELLSKKQIDPDNFGTDEQKELAQLQELIKCS